MLKTEKKIISKMSKALDECDDERFERLRRELDDFRVWMGVRRGR